VIITIEASDDPGEAARWVAQVADGIAAGRSEGYADFHTNWKARPGCDHLACKDAAGC
jgi:hypothetical protein